MSTLSMDNKRIRNRKAQCLATALPNNKVRYAVYLSDLCRFCSLCQIDTYDSHSSKE
jgi:hypothetical protein